MYFGGPPNEILSGGRGANWSGAALSESVISTSDSCVSQGDKEAELGLSFSPLCDRKSTMVAQSQIGESQEHRRNRT